VGRGAKAGGDAVNVVIRFLACYLFGALAGVNLTVLIPPDSSYSASWLNVVMSFAFAAFYFHRTDD
jgi:hypothetical protein